MAVGQAKDASKEFVYDFSHWSVRPTDLGFASQNKVETCTISIVNPSCSGHAGVSGSGARGASVCIQGLQHMHFCIRTDRQWQNIHNDGD